ncbi:MAG TPA: SIS domain-containing protein [Geminicoccus sp.]|uniref:D-sedoheptulose-7-phosphate isomerase n=1 Tax=Geminicoccus sp. TaxID=2024832 RepID=UPI002B709E97|nr:SIS domain-containing protein [Geminicoccus sp.]HWL69115.1 SIS domain-containing protein [Geminicoccus sp.]
MNGTSWLDWAEASRLVLADSLAAFDEARVEAAAEAMVAALAADRPMLICGNGGSAADSLHFSGELVGRFKRDRRPYRVLSLAADPVFLTAWSNDASFADVFARQVQAHGTEGGVLVGFTTSGRSPNVLAAFEAARERRMTTVALTGDGGNALDGQVDHLFAVPATDTALVQQVHLVLYHHWCRVLEARLA